ncbi:GIY-YIG nuclease family protein [Winogradskyella wichelsiae]|uniref:GIY-YIG nuclease family protein n=1 Tax=Winogradskyella wichelsiae TaxID=2697007 RepID=UPI0015CC8FC6|nr:GIY-YIG nuclease family protein [Winogradskyella wichelsiae]
MNNNSEFEFKSYFPNYQLEFSFKNWLVQDGCFVKEGEYIYEYSNSIIVNSQLALLGAKPNYTLTRHKAEKSGYIDLYFTNKPLHIPKNQLMYVIREKDKERIDRKFINKPTIIIDEFNNSKKIIWERVSSDFLISQGIKSKSDDFKTELVFCFNYEQNNDYLVFYFDPKQIKPKQNDKISLLFENGEIIELVLKNKPIFSKNELNNKILVYKTIITESELHLFSNTDFRKWKLTLSSGEREILGGEIGGYKSYESRSNLTIAIKKYANDYIDVVQRTIPEHQPLKIRQTSIINEAKNKYCFVYLMKDSTNSYYKIGISNQPKYRERTLQSEKPTIEMIIAKKFPIRKIAESFEKSLHETYVEKRVRGEWFELNQIDVEHIIESLK